MSTEPLNYYEILDVPQTADQHRIFEAYKEAQKTFSLQNTQLFNVFSQQEAQDWLDLIEEAYRVIGSPNARREYDMELQDKINPSLPGMEMTSSKEDKTIENPVREEPLPEGFARTKLSQFEVKRNMEELIASQDLFDGLFLKKVREYKNIGLNQFSQATCIAIRHLYAIENNNFSVLPAAVFVRGYIIQYCRILDLDETKVVPSFMSILKNA